MSKVKNYTVGTDPEVFLWDPTKEQYVGSIGIVPGSKKEPHLFYNAEGYKVLCDNLSVEFNVPPAKIAEEFADNIIFAMNYIQNEIIPSPLQIAVVTTADFGFDDFVKPGAMEFGCEPDTNAWTGKENPVPDASTIWFRAAGGHIHVGYDNHNHKTNMELIKAIEVNLTLPLVLMDPDFRRRQIYGGAGAYRTTKYGVESRSPSNYWVRDRNHIIWAFRRVQDAIKDVNNGVKYDVFASEIIDAINNTNKELASSLLTKFGKQQAVYVG